MLVSNLISQDCNKWGTLSKSFVLDFNSVIVYCHVSTLCINRQCPSNGTPFRSSKLFIVLVTFSVVGLSCIICVLNEKKLRSTCYQIHVRFCTFLYHCWTYAFNSSRDKCETPKRQKSEITKHRFQNHESRWQDNLGRPKTDDLIPSIHACVIMD